MAGEDRGTVRSGKLRSYLGVAPRVGTTDAMLGEVSR